MMSLDVYALSTPLATPPLQFDCKKYTSTYIFYDDLETMVDPNHCTDLFIASEKGKLTIVICDITQNF